MCFAFVFCLCCIRTHSSGLVVTVCQSEWACSVSVFSACVCVCIVAKLVWDFDVCFLTVDVYSCVAVHRICAMAWPQMVWNTLFIQYWDFFNSVTNCDVLKILNVDVGCLFVVVCFGWLCFTYVWYIVKLLLSHSIINILCMYDRVGIVGMYAPVVAHSFTHSNTVLVLPFVLFVWHSNTIVQSLFWKNTCMMDVRLSSFCTWLCVYVLHVSRNHFGCNINETLIMDVADLIVGKNLSLAGYNYVNMDGIHMHTRAHTLSRIQWHTHTYTHTHTSNINI